MAEATVYTDGLISGVSRFDPYSGKMSAGLDSIGSSAMNDVAFLQEATPHLVRITASNGDVWTSGIKGMVQIASISTTALDQSVAYFASEADRIAGTVTISTAGAPSTFMAIYWTRA